MAIAVTAVKFGAWGISRLIAAVSIIMKTVIFFWVFEVIIFFPLQWLVQWLAHHAEQDPQMSI
jgi:hypothetical protein